MTVISLARSKSRAGSPVADIDELSAVDSSIQRASAALLALQAEDGHWRFELETDCTITAEYILMMHFMDELDGALQEKLARYIRAKQMRNRHGGWPLYQGGDMDLSCTVKCYYALKAAGDDADAPHMQQAREAVLAAGGAAKSNVFTRILLAMFGQVPWRAVPYIPVEIMLLPRWFPFHLDKVSYWARTTMVPLFILISKKAQAKNPQAIGVPELFVVPPEQERHFYANGGLLNKLFLGVDRIGRTLDPLIPAAVRQHAIGKAERWFVDRLNGEDGIGAIFPPMVNSYEAMALLGYPKDHPLRATCLKAIQKLLVFRDDGSAYCQACVSPVWDTAWSVMALLRAGETAGAGSAIEKAMEWLASKQELELKGDWAARAPDLAPGGWAFQYANAYYPDLDDTSVVASLLHIVPTGTPEAEKYRHRIDRAADWLVGLQSKNGGFAAFDADNTYHYLNAIPFADHGALLDPPTEDVTGRVLAFLGIIGRPQDKEAIRRGIAYCKRLQKPDGSWWGRWGTNFIYGTWSVLAGLALAGEDLQQPYIRKAVDWLKSRQHPDGGWGETNDSYADPRLAGTMDGVSTANSTAWALLGLLSAGEVQSQAVERGVRFLLGNQLGDGVWRHPSFNAPGFPRVFYLKYHGYTTYFPLWALTRYRQLMARAKTA